LPRYGLAIFSTNSWGRSSGTTTPRSGFWIIQSVAATTEMATCMVVAFWCGTSRRDSSMERSLPTHQELYGCPMMRAPRMSEPLVISSFKIR